MLGSHVINVMNYNTSVLCLVNFDLCLTNLLLCLVNFDLFLTKSLLRLVNFDLCLTNSLLCFVDMGHRRLAILVCK